MDRLPRRRWNGCSKHASAGAYGQQSAPSEPAEAALLTLIDEVLVEGRQLTRQDIAKVRRTLRLLVRNSNGARGEPQSSAGLTNDDSEIIRRQKRRIEVLCEQLELVKTCTYDKDEALRRSQVSLEEMKRQRQGLVEKLANRDVDPAKGVELARCQEEQLAKQKKSMDSQSKQIDTLKTLLAHRREAAAVKCLVDTAETQDGKVEIQGEEKTARLDENSKTRDQAQVLIERNKEIEDLSRRLRESEQRAAWGEAASQSAKKRASERGQLINSLCSEKKQKDEQLGRQSDKIKDLEARLRTADLKRKQQKATLALSRHWRGSDQFLRKAAEKGVSAFLTRVWYGTKIGWVNFLACERDLCNREAGPRSLSLAEQDSLCRASNLDPERWRIHLTKVYCGANSAYTQQRNGRNEEAHSVAAIDVARWLNLQSQGVLVTMDDSVYQVVDALFSFVFGVKRDADEETLRAAPTRSDGKLVHDAWHGGGGRRSKKRKMLSVDHHRAPLKPAPQMLAT